jgi:hypothetical protein
MKKFDALMDHPRGPRGQGWQHGDEHKPTG